MSEAALAEVLQVVLIVLLIYFGFKIFIRWFGPLILKYFLKKIGKNLEKKFGQFDKTQKPQDNPEVEKKTSKNRRSKKQVGEYIDYEEIE